MKNYVAKASVNNCGGFDISPRLQGGNMTSEHCSSEITELAKTLLKVQRQLQPVLKDSENPFTKSWYASLKSVMAACRDALFDNGIWLCQYPVPVDSPGCLGLVTKLTHAESGQWQSSLAVVPLPKADPQGLGSAITYARRYTLCAMLGIVTEDDDAEEAKMPAKQAENARRARNAPQAQKGVSDKAGTRNVFTRRLKIDTTAWRFLRPAAH